MTVINPTPPPGPAPAGMVWIPGGTFWMGCEDCQMPDALPLHLVTVDGFWMDETPITNAQYETFIKATGYRTIAERSPDPKDFPGADPKLLVPGSAVFTQAFFSSHVAPSWQPNSGTESQLTVAPQPFGMLPHSTPFFSRASLQRSAVGRGTQVEASRSRPSLSASLSERIAL